MAFSHVDGDHLQVKYERSSREFGLMRICAPPTLPSQCTSVSLSAPLQDAKKRKTALIKVRVLGFGADYKSRYAGFPQSRFQLIWFAFRNSMDRVIVTVEQRLESCNASRLGRVYYIKAALAGGRSSLSTRGWPFQVSIRSVLPVDNDSTSIPSLSLSSCIPRRKIPQR